MIDRWQQFWTVRKSWWTFGCLCGILVTLLAVIAFLLYVSAVLSS